MRTLILATTLLASSIAVASPRHGGPIPMETLTAALALDAEQATQVEQILETQRARMQGLRELDRSERRAEMQQVREELRAQLEAVLSAEQLTAFEELRAARRGGRGRPAYDD